MGVEGLEPASCACIDGRDLVCFREIIEDQIDNADPNPPPSLCLILRPSPGAYIEPVVPQYGAAVRYDADSG